MPTLFTHGLVGLAAGKIFYNQTQTRKLWLFSLILPILPDLDVIGFRMGIRYADAFGHRGFFHSLFFAAIMGFAATTLFFRHLKAFSTGWWRLSLYFSLITATHGTLDAMTRGGGLGIAFFAPFDNTRYFLPWRVIKVSPVRIDSFLSMKGVHVMVSEFFWIWLPVGLLVLLVIYFRRRGDQSRKYRK